MKQMRINPFSVTAGPERRFKITPEMAEELKELEQMFQNKFGREPGPGDPIFFDPDSDTPQFWTKAQQKAATEEMCAVMLSTGVDAAFIYAFRKTGRILTTENMQYATRAELAEWNAAVEEFHKCKGPIQ
jgi:hypothetical protein